jgi:Carbohydrate family 9 binding domain-like
MHAAPEHGAGRLFTPLSAVLKAGVASGALLLCGSAWAANASSSPTDEPSLLRPALDMDGRPPIRLTQAPGPAPLRKSAEPAPETLRFAFEMPSAALAALSGMEGQTQTQVAGFVRPNVAAVRISPTEAPTIDGDVSDPVWAKANVIDNFIQKSPNPGQPATERTEVRILYDENNLYLSFYNFDRDPNAIIARSLERDGPLFTADSDVIFIDPGLTRRNAYSFEIGASGGRRDQLELNNTTELTEWNTIWAARAKRTPDGWTAEMSIPFRDLSYDAGQTTWGFDVRRRIRHKNEQVYWSGWAPTLEFTDVSQTGNLTGIENVSQGLGLDVQVYGRLQSKHNWQQPGDGAGLSFTAGGNAFYKVTPALTDTLTVNPDFSDAPLDVRQVNTTRFSLFTPETRDFFLQDSASFEFGGRNFGRNSQDRTSNNGRPFFSRNLGLAQGMPVSLRVGDKLSGQYAGFDIGALSVLTDNTPNANGQVLSVVRVTHPVLSESKVGFIVTNGDPTGQTSNTVAGLDFQYRDSDFLGQYIFQSDGYLMQSRSSRTGNDTSGALTFNFPNEPWSADLVIKQIGANFTPALGFINRTDMRSYQGTVAHLDRYRGQYLNQLEMGTNYEFVTDLGNHLESRENDVYVSARATVGDEVTFRLINDFESVPATFFLPLSVPVAPGDYSWNNFDVRVRTFDGRLVSLDVELICCSFYNGTSIHPRIRAAYRPNAYFEFIPTYDLTMIDLPTGTVNIHLFTIDSVVNFVPDMQMSIQMQYDNISGNLGFSARYRWEYEPGNELFVALGQSGNYLTSRFVAQTTLLSVRLGHTFRF